VLDLDVGGIGWAGKERGSRSLAPYALCWWIRHTAVWALLIRPISVSKLHPCARSHRFKRDLSELTGPPGIAQDCLLTYRAALSARSKDLGAG